MNGFDIAVAILDKADRIEREKEGRALTPEEVSAVQAADFLRKIWPTHEVPLPRPTAPVNE